MGKQTLKKTAGTTKKPNIELRRKMRDPSKSVDDAKALADALYPRLGALKDAIGQNYNYPVSESTERALEEIIKKEWPGETPFQRNIELRTILKDQDLIKEEPTGVWMPNMSLCRWVVKDWGGTDRKEKSGDNLEKLVANRLSQLKASQPNTSDQIEFDRVSSWSKIFALAFPDDCAIYDSRTAFTLNFIQFQLSQNDDDSHHFKYWPMPSGANTLLRLLDFNLFLMIHHIKDIEKHIEHEQSNALSNPNKAGKSTLAGRVRKKIQVPKSRAYRAYCNTLLHLSKLLYGQEEYGLLKTEMLLFCASTQVMPAEVAKYICNLIDDTDQCIAPTISA